MTERGKFEILYTDGDRMLIHAKPTIPWVERLLKTKILDTVALGNDEVMLVPDSGLIDGLPVNGHATRIVQERRPGYRHSIHGDVVVVNDLDFG